MSLIKQLWIAIALAMSIAFGGSMIVSVLSARHYLEQQLQVKNIDNATALALSLSQLPKDPVTVELQIAAQFDAGHYRFIRIVSPTGQTLVERVFEGQLQTAPRWFSRMIPIQVEPGRAQIQDGWKQYGTVLVASQEDYVYKSLWEGMLELLLWFVIGGSLAGAAGTLLIRYIKRPLSDVVSQAEAIAERRFLTIQEPFTPELRSVVRAMNAMVFRLKVMFSDEAARLENLRQKVNRDGVTGLANRDYFLAHLREIVDGEQFQSVGSLVLIRLLDLTEINLRLGHQRTNALLKQLGSILDASSDDAIGQSAGRLKGGEFAMVFPSIASPTAATDILYNLLLKEWLPHWTTEMPDLFHLAAVRYHRDQNMGQLLSHADEAMAHAVELGPNSHFADEGGTAHAALPAEQWRTLLTEAVQGGRLTLAYFPVLRGDGQSTLHTEGMIRLRGADGSNIAPLSAGDFMPMAARLNLTAPIDLTVVKLAIEHLRTAAGDIAVNLSAETIGNFNFHNELAQLLKTHPDACQRLLFEVSEYGVFRQFEAFRELARKLKQLGCRVGIEYFGQRFTETDKLTSLGLDYLKIHPSYIRGIAANPGNQKFLKGLCNMAHTIGMVVIALGVEQQTDLPLLSALGFDGVTGPGIK